MAQNVSFLDQNPSYTYAVKSTPDSTYGSADISDADLGEFFSRPVKIEEFQWSTSVNFYEDFNPWSDYFENPRVINRISNFMLLRAKLHVKILVNGNGFYYGRLLANYQPLPSSDQFILDRGLIPQDNIAASQRPHIYIDPTTSQGGELELPFFWYNNALRITDSEWEKMGKMSIRTLTQLKHANGATDPITISVFAWASDVSLAVPTSTNPSTLVSQMGYEQKSKKKSSKPRVTVTRNNKKPSPKMNDEYGSGIVSKPASTVARIAGMLSNAPVIGPYAKATEIAAGGISNIAKLFGYSRPTPVEPITQLTPRFYGDIATTNIPDSIQKLTIDAKQELTVDGSTVGLDNTDEMTVKSIMTRESYLTDFNWFMSTSPETRLWSCEVSPTLWDVVTGTQTPTPYDEVHMPACCFGSLPFKEWRGTVKFRFQIVASEYHRGRLKIVYEPAELSSDEYNTNYTHIVDISEDKDFTVEIGWGSNFGYLGHRSPGVSSIPFTSGTQAAPTSYIANGLIGVSVVNELTSPNSVVDNNIKVNVFVSAGDDIEVKNPDPTLIENLTPYLPQSGFEAQAGEEGTMVQEDADCTEEPSAPMQKMVNATMAAIPNDSDPISSVYFGEEIVSFRQCLKRYNFFSYMPFTLSGTSSNRISTYILDYFPYYRGEALTNAAFGSGNYSKLTLLNYLTPAYAGMRGGIRWKWAMVGNCNPSSYPFMQINREPQLQSATSSWVDSIVSLIGTYNYQQMQAINDKLPHTWAGAMVTACMQQPVVEAEIPFQKRFRFRPARRRDFKGSASSDFDNSYRVDHLGDSTSSRGNGAMAYCAAGEDYSLFFFIGSPVWWVETTIP